MYPDLSYVFHALLGTQPDNMLSLFKTFGLLLVIAILSAAFILYGELKRKADEGLFEGQKILLEPARAASWGEILTNAFFGFVLGFKIPFIVQNLEAMKRDAADVLLTSDGNWLVGILGALVFGGYQYWKGQQRAKSKAQAKEVTMFPHDRIGDITIIAAIAGVVGAKVFALIEDLPAFFADPIGTFLSGSGLAIYGGLIGGFLGVSWYLRGKKIPVVHVLDAVAPALILAYGIGRLGCHFSGDGDWGIVNELAQPSWWFFPDWLWAYDYPHNVINEGIPMDGCTFRYCRHLAAPVYPTPLYETIMTVIIFSILWAIRKRITIPGILFFIYLMFNGVERFLIEKIRVNLKYEVLGMQLTQAEIIAIVLFLIGAIGCFVLWRRAVPARN
ncbi:MAG: hypothetical protein DHS20C18_05630 [Saprospiraceae bacterium]|nr:MAG: hypothetical protein DHS20C18_05630 [Saprospiraceae bacterium]